MEGEVGAGNAERCSQSKILTTDGVDEADVQLVWARPETRTCSAKQAAEAGDDLIDLRRDFRIYILSS